MLQNYSIFIVSENVYGNIRCDNSFWQEYTYISNLYLQLGQIFELFENKNHLLVAYNKHSANVLADMRYWHSFRSSFVGLYTCIDGTRYIYTV